MRHSWKAVVVSVSLLIVPSTVEASVQPSTPNDGMPSQSQVDVTANAQTFAGLWGDVTGGVAGRPYVTNLSVTATNKDSGATETREFITGGTVTTPESTTAGDIVFVMTPTNVCNKAKGETPVSKQCYDSPNRIGGSLAYVKGPGQVGSNFSNPTNSQGQAISTPLLDLIKQERTNVVVDMTINMNTWGSSLRWTWFNGVPTYWSVTDLGAPASIVRVKFSLDTGPSQVCDTRIPVEGCDPAQAAKNNGGTFAPTKVKKAEFVFSLDNTGIDPVFSGALFSSVNADMGSLEAQPLGSPTLGLTYGVSGVSELSGAANTATFRAFVSDVSLTNYFGVTQETLDNPDFRSSEMLRVTRADGGTSGEPVWERMAAADFGTSGYYLTVMDIKFDGQAVASSGVRSFAQTATKPAKFVVGNKLTSKVSVSRIGGGRNGVRLSASGSACRKVPCRWVISRSTSKLSGSTKKLATVATRKGTATASAKVKVAKGNILLAQLQRKVKGKWIFVTARSAVSK